MNGLLGRTRRVLAGLISAMMVLTSLPLTGVAAYAAPSDNAVKEAEVAAEEATSEAADVVEDDAVADEVSEPATADETASGNVTVFFTRPASDEAIQSVTVSNTTIPFGTEDTVSANVPAEDSFVFKVNMADGTIPYFVYASVVDGEDSVDLQRDEEDIFSFGYTTTDADAEINLESSAFKIYTENDLITPEFVGTVVDGEDNYIGTDFADITFSLSSISANILAFKNAIAAAGETGQVTLDWDDETGPYTIHDEDLKNVAFEFKSDLVIDAFEVTYETSKIIAPTNPEVTFTEDKDSLVSFNNVYYAKKDTDYKFRVDPTPATVSAGKAVSKVTYAVGDAAAKPVTADGEGFYAIPADDILAAAKEEANITIAATTTQAKQNVTFKANEHVKAITYGPSTGEENTVSMAKAKRDSGVIEQIDTNTEQKMMVYAPFYDTVLLSDSVKVNGTVIDSYGIGQADSDTRFYKYKLSVNEAPVTVDVAAYKKVPISMNNLKEGDKTLATVGLTFGGTTDNLTSGEVIKFYYSYNLSEDVSDYDVTLKDPKVYYVKRDDTTVDITPVHEGEDKTGEYTIRLEDVEAAIKAGAKKIVIQAVGDPVPKVKATIEVPAKGKNVLGDIVSVTFKEKDSNGKDKDEKVVSQWETLSDNNGAWYAKADIELQKGNSLVIDDGISFEDDTKRVDFVRVLKGNTEILPSHDVYNLGSFKEAGTVKIETARFTADEVAFDITGNSDTVSFNLAIAERYATTLEGISYINAGEEETYLEPVEAIENKDTVNRYKLGNIRYAVVNNGSKGSAGEDKEGYFFIDQKAIKEAAFATPVNGKKLTVSAEVMTNGFRDQKLAVAASKGFDVKVASNGKSVGGHDGGADLHTDYEIKYKAGATATITPKPGFELKKVYVIKEENKKAAALSGNFVYADLLAKINAGKLAATEVTVTNGTATATVKSMDDWYTVLVVTEPKLEVVVTGKVTEWQGGTPVPKTVTLKPDSKGFYNALWGIEYKLEVVSGDNALPLSRNSISASFIDDETGAAVPSSVFGGLDAAPLKFFTFSGADVGGKKVMVEFKTADGSAEKAIPFIVTKRPTADSVKFTEGVLSENGIEIKKAQPLGTSRSYKLTFGPEIAGHVGIMGSELPTGVEAKLVDIKDKKGNITGATLTVTSDPRKDLEGKEAEIQFHDATAKGDAAVFKKVKVRFSTEQVTNADLSKIKATGNTDSITLDFSGVTGIDRTTARLYYHVEVSTGSTVSECRPLYDKVEKLLVPATASSYTVRLTDRLEEVCPNEITYKVDVELVQVTDTGDAGEYDEGKLIEASTGKFSESVKTVVDGVFASRITLKKVKTAPKVIYGDGMEEFFYYPGVDPYTFIGMDEFLLATVNYPDIKKVGAVTVRRIKKLELINSAGEVVDEVAADGRGTFLREEQNNVYLSTVDLAPGKYTITAYAVEPRGKDVTASLKITVAQAIYKTEVVVPSVIYKAPGKAATIKPAVIYNDGEKQYKPRTKKVTWSVKCNGSYVLPAGVTFKKGKITIGKNVTIPEEGLTFSIKAVPADYNHEDNYSAESVDVEVSSVAQVPARLVIDGRVVEEGERLGRDLLGDVEVQDADGNKIESVTWKASGALKKSSLFGNTYVAPVRFGTGQIKVTTTDGSKKTRIFTYKVKSDTGIRGEFVEPFAGKEVVFDDLTDTYEIDNRSPAGRPVYLDFVGRENNSFVEHEVQLDGFKKIKGESTLINFIYGVPGEYTLVPTKHDATIKIYEGKGRSKTLKVTLKVTNYGIPAASNVQTKITASNKIFTTVGKKQPVDKKGVIFTNFDFGSKAEYDKVSYNNVTYTVKYGKKAASKGEKVRVSVVKDNDLYYMYLFLKSKYAGIWNEDSDTADFTLGEGGTFSINYVQDDGSFAIPKGTYKLQMTPVDKDGNAICKPATITLKITAAPKKASFTAKKVNFDTVSAGSAVPLDFAKISNAAIYGNSTTATSAVFGAEEIGGFKDLDVRGDNVGGKINGFEKMFTVQDGKLVYTGVKPKDYSAKKGIKGYVAVTYTAMDGQRKLTYIPVTVKGNFK